MACNFSFSGVLLRCTGFEWDIRKLFPYEVYKKINFKVPIGFYSDCFERYIIRVEEMRESCSIINFCINNIPNGLIKVDNAKFSIPKRLNIKNSMESIISHFKLYSEGIIITPEIVYSSVEAPKGEFGVFIASDGTNKPYRCKLRAPGFYHIQSIDYMSSGYILADLVAIIGTQDLVLGEIDKIF